MIELLDLLFCVCILFLRFPKLMEYEFYFIVRRFAYRNVLKLVILRVHDSWFSHEHDFFVKKFYGRSWKCYHGASELNIMEQVEASDGDVNGRERGLQKCACVQHDHLSILHGGK